MVCVRVVTLKFCIVITPVPFTPTDALTIDAVKGFFILSFFAIWQANKC